MKLSICIPTYNFAAFIPHTLDSIVGQICDGVEVIVLDGGSSDDTYEILNRYCKEHKFIRYFRQAQRGGIDRDLAATVDHAVGEYVWLLSSDDLLRPGAISRILREVASGDDVYLCRHSNCLIDMTYVSDHPVIDSVRDITFDLSSVYERSIYFGLAKSSEAFFSFMSGLVINRSRWASVMSKERFVGSCWAHVSRILEMIPTRLRVRYISEILVDKRGENDSFSERGVVNRYRIGIEGFDSIAKHYFGKASIEYRHIMRIIRKEFPLLSFLYAKELCYRSNGKESIQRLNALAKINFLQPSVVARAQYLVYRLIPSGFIGILRHLRRSVRIVRSRRGRPIG